MGWVEIHNGLARTALLYSIILGGWGLLRYFRRTGIDSSYWGALAIAEILYILQGILGIIMYMGGLRPERGWFHILYGVVGVLVIPALFAWTRGGDQRRAMLVYGVGLLFLAGIAARAMATGG